MSDVSVKAMAKRALSAKGLSVKGVAPKTLIKVETQGHSYELLVVDPKVSSVLMCSNHPQAPGPLPFNAGVDPGTPSHQGG